MKASADQAATKYRMAWNPFKTPSPAVTPPATTNKDSSSPDSITQQPDSPVVLYPEDLRDAGTLFSSPQPEKGKQPDRALQHNSSAAYVYPSSPSTAATPGSQQSSAFSPYKAAPPLLRNTTAVSAPLDSSSSNSSRSTDGVESFPPVDDTPGSSPARASTSLMSALPAFEGIPQNTPSPPPSANRRTNRPRSRLSNNANEREAPPHPILPP